MFVVKSHREWSAREIWVSLGGLVLQKASGETFERVGLCKFELSPNTPFVYRKASLRDNFEWRYARQFLALLPVRSYKIV